MVERQISLTRPGRQRNRNRESIQGENRNFADEELDSGYEKKKKPSFEHWAFFARALTCCVPEAFIRGCGVPNIQAWREKIALCFIILIIQSVAAFITFGLQQVFCGLPGNPGVPAIVNDNGKLTRFVQSSDVVIIYGKLYNAQAVSNALKSTGANLTPDFGGLDITDLFVPPIDPCRAEVCPLCNANLPPRKCSVTNPVTADVLAASDKKCISFDVFRAAGIPAIDDLTFDWPDLHADPNFQQFPLTVYNGLVLNVTEYFVFRKKNTPATTDPWFIVDATLTRNLGIDATINMQAYPETVKAADCIASRFRVGFLDKESVGCGAAQVILSAATVVVVGVIIVRFIMAITFSWFLSKNLVKINRPTNRGENKNSPDTDLRDSNIGEPGLDATKLNPINAVGDPLLYTMMLVTCYSEGEASLRTTLESLAATEYEPKYKMFFIIADGIIKGEGEDHSTPDLVINMLTIAPEMRNPIPCSYIAIADGEKQHNMAKVYAGRFNHNEHSVPVILVVKCGTPSEANAAKPGNRGKRDSQVLLMNFLSRVLFDDRMTELDYDLFWKVQYLMGTTVDRFELVLMVDADTRVNPDSLSYMVRAMERDPMIMGLCGETRIANKRDSFTTWIQVFEYYISHHLGKAFESVFGGVTCLPGCFCMYRIKARKNGAWVPILANPDIVQEYCQNVVDTLHKKNLLLLGEDRFLSTLMLRNFPKRQMMFIPQAICKTVVPDTFSVLLSQRRRWINSTIHNLLELVLVSDLCGIACLSMQFVVFMELIGTVVLPAAIVFTVYLLVSLILNRGAQEILPLLMLLAVLGLPAVLILVTTRKVIYIAWMFVYLLALPVWNLILPLYAFWHFDDFSWGQTRVVAGEGEGKGGGHGEKEGEFDTSAITMRKWNEWERERRGGTAADSLRQSRYVPPMNTSSPSTSYSRENGM